MFFSMYLEFEHLTCTLHVHFVVHPGFIPQALQIRSPDQSVPLRQHGLDKSVLGNTCCLYCYQRDGSHSVTRDLRMCSDANMNIKLLNFRFHPETETESRESFAFLMRMSRVLRRLP